ncbi:hypothetical protein [Amycolatopsis ultiminotia]|uniref:hypothetical protein n=1 Tax=Amycolatopsis ultiminotia TaxID=543629 RepID=UPI0031F1739F
MTQVLLADKRADAAEAVAMSAVADVRADLRVENSDAMAVSGALLLIAAVAAVRDGKVWAGRDYLRQVAPLADRIGNRNVCWTAFGPVNVAMYAVSIEVESGEAVEGLRLAAKVDHERSPSIERRVAFLLEQSKGYLQRREYKEALNLLEAAETDAQEDVRFRPAAHALVRSPMERGRRSEAHEAARLATRIGLPG